MARFLCIRYVQVVYIGEFINRIVDMSDMKFMHMQNITILLISLVDKGRIYKRCFNVSMLSCYASY
ncbi:hypothetical protein WM54_12995 [Aeromonas veronii]|nr:hypothetical protein WM54_12995 [Aeromonas veronii]